MLAINEKQFLFKGFLWSRGRYDADVGLVEGVLELENLVIFCLESGLKILLDQVEFLLQLRLTHLNTF